MRFLLKPLFALMLCSVFPVQVGAQDMQIANLDQADHALYIYIKPQSFVFGANIGVDFSLSLRATIGGEITTHCWWVPSNIAITPIFKYYFKGCVGNGLYARAKLVAGLFFNETAIGDHPYYAGGGVGIGGITSLSKSGRWYIFADLGIKFASPFGNRSRSTKDKGNWAPAYYTLLSPASMPELSFGIAFRI